MLGYYYKQVQREQKEQFIPVTLKTKVKITEINVSRTRNLDTPIITEEMEPAKPGLPDTSTSYSQQTLWGPSPHLRQPNAGNWKHTGPPSSVSANLVIKVRQGQWKKNHKSVWPMNSDGKILIKMSTNYISPSLKISSREGFSPRDSVVVQKTC